MAVLSAIFLAFEAAQLQSYFGAIFNLVLTRLQSNKKVAPHVVGAWAIFVARYGAAAFKDSLNAVQAGLYNQIMRAIWAEHAGYTQGTARKTVCISTTKLLGAPLMMTDCGSERFQSGGPTRARARRHTTTGTPPCAS